MSRLAPFDKALVLILVPLWVVVFVLAVRAQVQGGSFVTLGLSVENADSYPVLTGEYSPFTNPSDPLAAAHLQAGDRVLRLGESDLRGVGTTLGAVAYSLEEGRGELLVPLVFERDGERRETLLALASVSVFRPGLFASFVLAASGLFLLFRAPPTPTVRAYFHSSIFLSLAVCSFPISRIEMYVWFVMFAAVGFVILPLLLRFLQRFPDDRVPEGAWHRIWPWFFAVHGLFAVCAFLGPLKIGERGMTGTQAVAVLVMLGVATSKYRRADLVARRQMKWALFGFYCAALPLALAVGLTALDSRLGWLWLASYGAFGLFPLALVISIVRFNLFDIDRILSAAASYNILAVILGTGALVLVPRIAEAASRALGIDQQAGQVALSLALAAVVVPAHRRLRPQIDRLFFKERYAFDHGIAELLPTLSACTDARELTERAGTGLYRLLRPEACVVYAGMEQSYAPVFVEGRAVPPAFEADSALIVALRERGGPLLLGASGQQPDHAPLGPFDRAALETLQAEVVVPVRQDEALAAFLCLGPKRSGDVYTGTDLSLLTAVAETVARELRRFEQDETIREAREMQESLRRYVPGAIAEQLSSGDELASGEREVTVLFVDIRGYTSFSESRGAEEIFSTINRYTETVSQIVQKYGGSVVEFNGDGMMTVFGAPRELAHKERAAVEAGREIVDAVGALTVEEPVGRETLAVGVGIATGEAFVGNIQAVDRMIWSAIGNTTNLAARLQSLTRDLDASLVIDCATWEGAQAAAAGFEKRPEVPIRGRRETQDVYVLPMQPDG